MERHYGTIGISPIECINPRLQKYRVRWDIQPYTNNNTDIRDNGNQVSFVEREFNHKPSMSEVKDTILSWMNSEIDKEIVGGFKWNGMDIWLSNENQFNYKAAYDLAVQTGGESLPVTFKFGTTDNPVYHEFDNIDTLSDFYTSSIRYIIDKLNEGWKRKDSFDFTIYEQLLNE